MLRKRGNSYFGEYLDLRTLVRKSGHEEVFLCPYCLGLTGTPDSKGKFYYSTRKQVGHCFKCEAVIVSTELRSIEQIRQQLDFVSDEDRYHVQKLSLSDWAFPIKENPECLDYMIYNRGIVPEVLNRFNVLATNTPRLGVVFCNKIWGGTITDFLIIRNVHSKMRHTIIRDQVKPLLWTNHVDTNSIILVEGTISGLSVYQYLDGNVCPLILLGKTISAFQLAQLKAIVAAKKVERIYVAMDGGFFENSIKVARQVYKALDHQDVFVIKLPFNKDPNSVTCKQFREIWENQTYPYMPLSTNILRYTAYGRR